MVVLPAPQLLLAEVAAVLLKKERAGAISASEAEAVLMDPPQRALLETVREAWPAPGAGGAPGAHSCSSPHSD
jgi:hypothetical protein